MFVPTSRAACLMEPFRLFMKPITNPTKFHTFLALSNNINKNIYQEKNIYNNQRRWFCSEQKGESPCTSKPPNHPNPPDPAKEKWGDKNLNFIFEANKEWSEQIHQNKLDMQSHAPNVLWIGCSDARIPANEIIQEPAGSVFVHRNIANMVVNTDVNCMSVIQYAISVLKVRHIIVCGHYDCGGINAALTNVNNVSPLENWLRNIRDVHRLHYQELALLPDKQAIARRLVELNVEEQCLNLFKTGVVQARRVETFEARKAGDKSISFTEPRIHPMVYDPTTGKAKRLEVDFLKVINDLKAVYQLYHTKPNEK